MRSFRSILLVMSFQRKRKWHVRGRRTVDTGTSLAVHRTEYPNPSFSAHAPCGIVRCTGVKHAGMNSRMQSNRLRGPPDWCGRYSSTTVDRTGTGDSPDSIVLSVRATSVSTSARTSAHACGCGIGLEHGVVAVEPQPLFAQWLRRRYGDSSQVTSWWRPLSLRSPGIVTLHVSERTPTVSSAVARSGCSRVRNGIRFPPSTGTPDTRACHHTGLTSSTCMACRLLQDRRRRLRTRSACSDFRVHCRHCPSSTCPPPGQIMLACIDRLAELGDYSFNWTVGERMSGSPMPGCDSDDIRHMLAVMPVDADSGDIYARLQSPATPAAAASNRRPLPVNPGADAMSTAYADADAQRRTVSGRCRQQRS